MGRQRISPNPSLLLSFFSLPTSRQAASARSKVKNPRPIKGKRQPTRATKRDRGAEASTCPPWPIKELSPVILANWSWEKDKETALEGIPK